MELVRKLQWCLGYRVSQWSNGPFGNVLEAADRLFLVDQKLNRVSPHACPDEGPVLSRKPTFSRIWEYDQHCGFDFCCEEYLLPLQRTEFDSQHPHLVATKHLEHQLHRVLTPLAAVGTAFLCPYQNKVKDIRIKKNKNEHTHTHTTESTVLLHPLSPQGQPALTFLWGSLLCSAK